MRASVEDRSSTCILGSSRTTVCSLLCGALLTGSTGTPRAIWSDTYSGEPAYPPSSSPWFLSTRGRSSCHVELLSGLVPVQSAVAAAGCFASPLLRVAWSARLNGGCHGSIWRNALVIPRPYQAGRSISPRSRVQDDKESRERELVASGTDDGSSSGSEKPPLELLDDARVAPKGVSS